jgi:hypothetical protein
MEVSVRHDLSEVGERVYSSGVPLYTSLASAQRGDGFRSSGDVTGSVERSHTHRQLMVIVVNSEKIKDTASTNHRSHT